MKSQIVQAIKTFNIAMLQILLDDDRTYMDVSKSLFLGTLAKKFESVKEEGCHSFDDVFYGVCKSENTVCDGMTFISDFGYYLDIYFEENAGSITDIRGCNKMFNFIELNKEYSLGLCFSKDDLVHFTPDMKYSFIQREFTLFLKDIALAPRTITLDELVEWYLDYSKMKTILQDIGFFRSMYYNLYTTAYGLICDFENILKLKTRANHALDALVSYQKATNESEKLIWLYENKIDRSNTLYFNLTKDLSNNSFVSYKSSNLDFHIDISGYEYVMDYFIKIDNFYEELMKKYEPLSEHFEQSKTGSIRYSLDNYLKLHNKHVDIVEKYGGDGRL